MPKTNFIRYRITRKNFLAMTEFLEALEIKIPPVIVLELCKIGFFRDQGLNYLNNFFCNSAFSFNEEMRKHIDETKNSLTSQISLLQGIERLYNSKNTAIIKEFLKSVPSSRRKNLIDTLDLSETETYIYNILANARKNNKKVTDDDIFLSLIKFKQYNIQNIESLKPVIKKLRHRVYNRMVRKKAAKK